MDENGTQQIALSLVCLLQVTQKRLPLPYEVTLVTVITK